MDDTNDTNDSFLDIFPKNIFGVIPPDIIKMLNESGFQKIVTIITVTDEDITEMETSCNIKLKLGHKRLLMQMVEYAKKIMPEIKPTSELANTSSISKAFTPKSTPMLPKNENEDSVVAMLKRMITKKSAAFCKLYKIEFPGIIAIQTIRTSENDYSGADITCSCGENVKICTNISKRNNAKYWILSNFARHLNRYHLPKTKEEYSINYFQFASSNESHESDFEENSKEENKIDQLEHSIEGEYDEEEIGYPISKR